MYSFGNIYIICTNLLYEELTSTDQSEHQVLIHYNLIVNIRVKP